MTAELNNFSSVFPKLCFDFDIMLLKIIFFVLTNCYHLHIHFNAVKAVMYVKDNKKKMIRMNITCNILYLMPTT